MIEKLDQLTIGLFIDLICEEADAILSGHEMPLTESNTIAIRNLIFEYKKIADPAGVNQYLSMLDDMINARIEVLLFSMCSGLVDLNEHEHAREVMILYGIDARTMNTQRVAAEVKSRLERAKNKVAEIQNEKEPEITASDSIRKQFDEQTAAMMTHFKFQIDTTTMKASVYAHLVARHNRESKAILAALKKK